MIRTLEDTGDILGQGLGEFLRTTIVGGETKVAFLKEVGLH